ncbi:pentatricopeptide repeat-containing protein At2g33680 [Selaginella moellendorffii]|uniref:pentatricopeptide repeat-containing protein At2g33680 n=1 Tax=Selaginella moellendorffii TaxID=88036 RepID=UPI000D1CE2EF|nr:pentatricopeptide repeat-containing protein At2g33680 [Selaginella moellendorffii]|eukprot:XP_024536203.1 pentatricopeptide repeat-containing protein At2g33680 [Selaginella moellendorffii]
MYLRIKRATTLVAVAVRRRSIITLSKEELAKESDVLEFLDSLHKGKLSRNEANYAQALHACTKLKALELGRQVHFEIHRSGFEENLQLGNHVINMYAKCGSLAEARAFFDKLSPERRNVFTWTAVMSAYAQTGHCKETVKLLGLMLLEAAVRPDRVVFIIMLESCSGTEDLPEGRMIHRLAVECGLVSQVMVANALINMYRKCGSPVLALQTFQSIEAPNIISWTSAIEAQSQNFCGGQALHLFHRMQLEGVRPNLITFAVVLEACDSSRFLDDARLLHKLAMENGFDGDSVVGTILVRTYVLCKSLDDARKTFDGLKLKSLVSWTAMIQAYAEKGLDKEAFHLYRGMGQEGLQPDRVSYLLLLGTCDRPEKLEVGKRIHSQLAAGGFERDTAVQIALVTMYGRCGDLEASTSVFSTIERSCDDEICWNAMLGAYGQNGHPDEAFALFRKFMLLGLKPSRPSFLTILGLCESLHTARTLHENVVESGLEQEFTIQTALISCYGKCGGLDDASKIFDGMEEWNQASCNAMMAAFSQRGQCGRAMELLRRMLLAGVKPTESTLVAALDACAAASSAAHGRHVHSLIDQAKHLETNVVLGNALAQMYGKCGRLEEACEVFHRVWSHDVVSWTGIVETHARYGRGGEALLLFYKMQQDGSRPNNISFTCILSACSHAGLVREGCQLFESLVRDHGLVPSELNFGCLVDLLGRAGRLDLAEGCLSRVALDRNLRMVLLGACRNQGDVERGRRAVGDVFAAKDSSSEAGYVLLSNLYAASTKK